MKKEIRVLPENSIKGNEKNFEKEETVTVESGSTADTDTWDFDAVDTAVPMDADNVATAALPKPVSLTNFRFLEDMSKNTLLHSTEVHDENVHTNTAETKPN